jgi:hypothetical protein
MMDLGQTLVARISDAAELSYRYILHFVKGFTWLEIYLEGYVHRRPCSC